MELTGTLFVLPVPLDVAIIASWLLLACDYQNIALVSGMGNANPSNTRSTNQVSMLTISAKQTVLVKAKSDDSPVTVADFGAQAVVCTGNEISSTT